MSKCLNPLRLFEIDKETKKIFGKEVDHVEVGFDGSIIPCKTKLVNPNCHHAVFTFREIPCRTCYSCRKSHALSWSERIMAELPYHDSAYFVTLTYHDSCLPHNSRGYSTLSTDDLQRFWKRLRKTQDTPIKYFACGEYGGTTYRPHYHAIVFGLKLDDLRIHQVDYQTGQTLYYSDHLASIWNNGFVSVGDVTIASARYVAGYVDKKLDHPRSGQFYKALDIEPEKLYISNGIGLRAYEDKIKDDLFNNKYSSSIIGTHEIHNNSYFTSKYKDSNPDEYEEWILSLEKQEKADRRARRKVMPDSVYYDSLDRENKRLIDNRKKRGDVYET